MSRRTQDPLGSADSFGYRAVTSYGWPFQTDSPNIYFCNSTMSVLQPQRGKPLWFGLFPFRSPLLRKSHLLSLPPGTKMFQFPGSAFLYLCIQYRMPSVQDGGLPHSEISGSTLTYSSPKHIGVRSVLHRLLVPRHPPCALSNFTFEMSRSIDRAYIVLLSSFQGTSKSCPFKTKQKLKLANDSFP